LIISIEQFVEVYFEDAILKEPVLLEHEYVKYLDGFRRRSFLGIHQVSKKSNPYESQSVPVI